MTRFSRYHVFPAKMTLVCALNAASYNLKLANLEINLPGFLTCRIEPLSEREVDVPMIPLSFLILPLVLHQ